MVTRLELFKIRYPQCTACGLHKSSQNVCVMGRGSPNSPIMLIGEAPGDQEAKTGKPFMGPAGQLLNEILGKLEMRHMCYITNIAKCRPPDNRKPKPKEVDTCTELYLKRELRLIKPEIIVLLGRTPIDHFFPHQPFRRGQMYTRGDWYLIPTWHPSYVIRGYSKAAYGELRAALELAKQGVQE